MDVDWAASERLVLVFRVIQEMAQNKILSAPLVVSDGLEDMDMGYDLIDVNRNGPSLLGWIDINDVLKALLRYLEDDGRTLRPSMLELMTQLDQEGPGFVNKMLVQVMGARVAVPWFRKQNVARMPTLNAPIQAAKTRGSFIKRT
jgi:hypothetical protein